MAFGWLSGALPHILLGVLSCHPVRAAGCGPHQRTVPAAVHIPKQQGSWLQPLPQVMGRAFPCLPWFWLCCRTCLQT